MAKRIVAIYDRGIDKNLMQGFDVLEKYGYELTLVEKTVNEDELAYQNSMLSVEVNGPDGTPINEEVFQYLDDAEIIITHFAPVSRRMIEAAKNLKIIATLRTGMENINMEAAKERGIKVINAPGRAAVAVADFTVAAMLCEIRNIARTDEDIKTGGWTKKYPNRTYSDNMCNLKVGLVGFGDIGKLIADAKLDGTGSLMMLPYVENFHGAVVGMSLSTTTDEIFAAILESLAYQFVACVDYIRSTRKQPFTRLHFGGGGSRTDKLLQLRADLIQAPLGRMQNIELPSLGACMLAGLGNNWYASVEDAAAHMSNPVSYFEPIPENETKYAERYAKYKAISADYLRHY